MWLPFGWFCWVSDHPAVAALSQGLDMMVRLDGIHGRRCCNDFCGSKQVPNTSNEKFMGPMVYMAQTFYSWPLRSDRLCPETPQAPKKLGKRPKFMVKSISFFSVVGGAGSTRMTLSFGLGQRPDRRPRWLKKPRTKFRNTWRRTAMWSAGDVPPTIGI